MKSARWSGRNVGGDVMNHRWHLTKRPVFETLILGCVGEAVGFPQTWTQSKTFFKCLKTKKTYPNVPKWNHGCQWRKMVATFAKEGGNNTLSPIIVVQWKKMVGYLKGSDPLEIHNKFSHKTMSFFWEEGNNNHQVIQAVTCLFPGWRSLNPWKGHKSPSPKGHQQNCQATIFVQPKPWGTQPPTSDYGFGREQ